MSIQPKNKEPATQTWHTRLDKTTFIGALILLVAVTVPLLLFPTAGAAFVAEAKIWMTDTLGGVYLTIGLTSFFFMIYLIFSDVGSIKLGEPEEAPEFSTASWAAMLFCGGIGASILYWAPIEWAYYYQNPPFNVAGGSQAAVLWSTVYGPFHWGPIAWSIYLVPAIPISYFFYVRRQPVLKVSTALAPAIGERRAAGGLGKIVDILFVFGLLGGGATTLGLAAPLINEGLAVLFGVDKSTTMQILVLLICTFIFGYSAYAGLDKGIKVLSNINFWTVMALLAFIFMVGPTIFMFDTGVDALGRMLSNFFDMATWTEPFAGLMGFLDTRFPQQWTVFYWAWWLVFSPAMGLFIARISRGRTIKEVVVGSLLFGSMGCFLFFMVLGNYALYLQLTGTVDVIAILGSGGPTAVYAVLQSLPLANLVILAFTLLAIIFTATTFDSISYILAAVVQSDVTEEPMRWNRLFWAFALSVMPITLLLLVGLETLQTAAIVGGIPLIVISVLLGGSAIRAAMVDLRRHPEYQFPIINIEDVTGIDPWSDAGIAQKRFERAIKVAQQAKNQQQEILAELYKVPRESQYDEERQRRRAELEEKLMEANERRAQASEAARRAREEFTVEMRYREQQQKTTTA